MSIFKAGHLSLSKCSRMFFGSRENAKRTLADGTRADIPWDLTLGEWLQVWVDSGHLHERGPRRGQYVMARKNDKGIYRVGNVKIITADNNMRESFKNGCHVRTRSCKIPLRLPPLKKLKRGPHLLTLYQVNYIRRNFIWGDRVFGGAALARKFNVSHQCVMYVIYGKHHDPRHP